MIRRAFVLQLGPDTDPRSRLDGWIEEVDSGRELRFRTTDELLDFLGQCFERARQREAADRRRDKGHEC